MQAIIIKVEIHLAYLEKKDTKRNRSLSRHTVMIPGPFSSSLRKEGERGLWE